MARQQSLLSVVRMSLMHMLVESGLSEDIGLKPMST